MLLVSFIVMLSVILLIATNVSGIMASAIMPIVVTPNILLWRNKLDLADPMSYRIFTAVIYNCKNISYSSNYRHFSKEYFSPMSLIHYGRKKRH